MRTRTVVGAAMLTAALAGPVLPLPPAAAATTTNVTGTALTVTGDDTDEMITVTCAGGNVVVNDLAPTGGPLACASMTALSVFGNAGNDRVDLSLLTNANCPALSSINAHLGSGNDRVFASHKDDSIDGSTGSDSYEGDGMSTVLATSTTITSDTLGTDAVTAIEAIAISATSSTDTVNLAGWPGTSTASLLGSADMFAGAAGRDHVVGGAGADQLNTNAGDDWIEPGADPDHITGGGGADTVVATAAGIVLSDAAMADGTNDVLSSIEEADLQLSAPGSLDASGFTGRALLTGSSGSDTLNGGGGDDTIRPGAGDDIVGGGAGSDTLEDANAQWTLTNTTLTGNGTDSFTGIESANLTGTAGADMITAASFTGRSTIDGDLGNDVIRGGTKADSLRGGEGQDKLFGLAGNDTLEGGPDKDTCRGGPGKDRLKRCEAGRP